ncbi:MAG: flavodoxin domain-containing protein [Candidatus Krumholzibacteria bacterium]|nr:flavodoxin domain-containing protein [Candidatus Krumholzibacteria bacterium]
MSVLIIYMSRHGCTAKAVDLLARALPGSAVFDLGAVKNPPLDAFDTVAIGGSIHAGKLQRKLSKFCRDNIEALKAKRLGLFLCCMEEGEKARLEFDQAYPAELREHAAATGLFGGAFDFERMNFLERAIVKKVAKLDKSVSKLDEKAIESFAEKLKGN